MESGRKLSKMMARFFPPGLILEFKDKYDNIDSRAIDLLDLTKNVDISYLIKDINEKEPLTRRNNDKIEKIIESNSKLLFNKNLFCYRIKSYFIRKKQ